MNSAAESGDEASVFPDANSTPPPEAAPAVARRDPLARLLISLEALQQREPRSGFERFLKRTIQLLRIPPPDKPKLLYRIRIMERDTILPIKVAAIAMLLYSFYFTHWVGVILDVLDIAVESTQYLLWIYIGLNAIVAGLLLRMYRVPPALLEWAVFTISLIDGIFLACLTLVTGGYNSILYWLFLALIVRGSISVPRGTAQLTLNLTISAYYILAGFIDIGISKWLQLSSLNLPNRGQVPILEHPEEGNEPLILRIVLLLLMTGCCYAVQVLMERQRQALEEAREFAVREGQLRSAGRLAAEIAHQLKNPLAIINNAAFSLQRALREGKGKPLEHVGIIQEEIDKSDRIITQVMGYAQLSEGHLEKLDLVEELDKAIQQVFPPAAGFNIHVHKDYVGNFPPLLMLRRHASESFLNLLQNAREALAPGPGNVFVRARCRPNNEAEVVIRDDGPGIPPDKQKKIFEAWYTTKEKGSGLGLATVKHNVELYGGTVRLQSELGKGSRFTLTFPARTLSEPEQNT
jgi:signal transduction histidine kinase